MTGKDKKGRWSPGGNSRVKRGMNGDVPPNILREDPYLRIFGRFIIKEFFIEVNRVFFNVLIGGTFVPIGPLLLPVVKGKSVLLPWWPK